MSKLQDWGWGALVMEEETTSVIMGIGLSEPGLEPSFSWPVVSCHFLWPLYMWLTPLPAVLFFFSVPEGRNFCYFRTQKPEWKSDHVPSSPDTRLSHMWCLLEAVELEISTFFVSIFINQLLINRINWEPVLSFSTDINLAQCPETWYLSCWGLLYLEETC